MVGSALLRRLDRVGAALLTAPRAELDLLRQAAVEDWVAEQAPDVAFIAAARVGGIVANDSAPGRFLYENLAIASNAIEACRSAGVRKVVFLGSTCVYPKHAPQPIPEDALLTGPLEPTNQWYAIAKIAGVMMCDAYRREYGCDFISAHPSNLYGPGDNYDLHESHVMAALIRKAHEAKATGAARMEVWGTGAPLREFTHVDDAADALVHLAEHYAAEGAVNIGTGEEIAIRDLARLICEVVGFEGDLSFDETKPDGTPRKVADASTLRALGWAPRIPLRAGIAQAYEWFLANDARGV